FIIFECGAHDAQKSRKLNLSFTSSLAGRKHYAALNGPPSSMARGAPWQSAIGQVRAIWVAAPSSLRNTKLFGWCVSQLSARAVKVHLQSATASIAFSSI